MNTAMNTTSSAAIVAAATVAASSNQTINAIRNLGHKLGEGFGKIADEAANAKEVSQRVTLDALDYLYNALSEEELASIPVPGTPITGDNGKPIPTNNPDKIEIPTRNKDGLTVMTKVSLVKELYDATPWAQHCISNLNDLSEAGKDGGNPSDRVAKMSVMDRKADKDYWTQRYNQGKGTLVRAIRLHHKWNELQGCKHIKVSWLMQGTGDDKKVRNTPKPIVIRDADNLDVFDFFSVSSFIAIDVAKAGGAAMTYETLKVSQKREMDKGDEGKGGRANASAALPQKIDSLDTFDARMTDIHEFLASIWDSKKADGGYAKLLAKLNGPGSDDLLMSIFDVQRMLSDITRKDGLAARYAALEEAIADGNESKAA